MPEPTPDQAPAADLLTVTAADGTEISCHRWLPAQDPVRAVVLIVHGLAEHAARYGRLAGHLVANGYAVYAPDHRGHGQTAAASSAFGVFAERNGWPTVVRDLRRVADLATDEHPDLPLFMLGHSMGSFLARSYAIDYGRQLDGLILSGTGADPGLLGKAGQLVAALECRLRGRGTPSPLLDKLSFGKFNDAFKPARTGFDWLSRDPAEVDKYVADPWCGRISSAGLFADMLGGLAEVNSPAYIARMPAQLPVLLISGALDPVGGRAAVSTVAGLFRAAGLTDVTTRSYPEARHEIFNETNRDEVTADVLAWLSAHLP